MIAKPRSHTWMLICTRLHQRQHQQLTPKRNTILHIAAQFGQLDCVKLILQLTSSSSLLGQSNLKETPTSPCREGRAFNTLHEAVRYHHPEVVKILIEEDPQFIYGPNISGGTPLYMAVERGHGDLVQIILDHTSTSPAYSGILGRTALHSAVIRNDQEITTKLLEWKPSLIKEVDENGWSPLHCAAHFGYTTIVKQLLHKSPDKSVAYLGIKRGKQTALLIAAKRGHKDIVDLLLSYSPDCCEQVNDNGKIKSKEAGLGPLSWVPDDKEDNDSSESEDNEDNSISTWKRKGETHLIVAALVATVTFAAGFTLPGGYNENEGKAILAKKAAFKAFVVTDTLAMVFSWSISKTLYLGLFLTMFGMGSMVVAFMTGMYAVLPHFSGLPIVVCVLCCCFSSSSIIYINNFKKLKGLMGCHLLILQP
ncbi:hypothetical protein AAG906_013128 [Vitis piasezkii]